MEEEMKKKVEEGGKKDANIAMLVETVEMKETMNTEKLKELEKAHSEAVEKFNEQIAEISKEKDQLEQKIN